MASSSKPSYFHLFSIPFQKLEFLNLEIKKLNKLKTVYSLNKQASGNLGEFMPDCVCMCTCVFTGAKESKTFIRFQKGP